MSYTNATIITEHSEGLALQTLAVLESGTRAPARQPHSPVPLVPVCLLCAAPLPYIGAPHISARIFDNGRACSRRRGLRRIPGGRFGVERTVFEQYARYPSLYGRSPWSRWHIFGHLFFVLGTGYTWQGGQLLYPGGGAAVRPAGQRLRLKTVRDEAEDMRRWRASHGSDPDPVRTHADEIAWIKASWTRFDGMPTRFYPIFDSSPIATIPPDIRPDWLAAARDAVAMLDVVVHAHLHSGSDALATGAAPEQGDRLGAPAHQAVTQAADRYAYHMHNLAWLPRLRAAVGV